MSVSIGSIVMTIKAIDEASGVMGKISASMGLIGAQLGQLGPGFSQLGNVIQGFAVAGPTGAAIVGIGEVVKGLQDAVVVAGDMQLAWTNLQSALQLSGTAWLDVQTKISGVVDKLRETTTFSDTQLVGAMQTLATYGMTAAQAMDALGAATELAAAKHIDLLTAATAIGKAFDGNTMLLARYGVQVSTLAKDTSLATEAIKEIGDKLATASTPQLEAFSTAMEAAGLSATSATGELKTHVQVVSELEAAWKSGSLTAKQLSDITAALGLNFEGSKAFAADFAGILGQVNAQYGGTAQAAASTYVGLQERLANAEQTLGEKIGNILLPALTSVLQAVIPMVDAFTNAIPAIEDWIAAIGKLPGISGAITSFQDTWNGFTKSLAEAWDSVKGDLLPVLQQLQDAFNQLNTALQPLWDAFNELWKAITGSSGDFNLFKAILEAIVLLIKGLVVVIQAVTPVIHVLAEAFKAMADFLVPILTAIRSAVQGFFDWLTKGFQAFYDWLVGHSLWQDLWTAVVNIVVSIGTTLKAIFDQAFTLWTDVFKLGTEAIKNILVTGFQIAFDAIQTVVAGTTGVLKGIFQGFIDLIGPAQVTWDQLVADVTSATISMKGTVTNFLSWLVDYWQKQISAVATFTATALQNIDNLVSSAAATAQSAWQNMLSAMVSSTRSALQQVYDEMNSKLNAIVAAVQAAKQQISSGSIWPDMLAEMVAQTHAGMTAIQGEFAGGFGSPSGILPTLQASGQATTAAAAAGAAPAAAGPGSQTILQPVNVYLDKQLIASYLEKSIVETIYRDAGRGKRGKA